jgi:hypothetical protein
METCADMYHEVNQTLVNTITRACTRKDLRVPRPRTEMAKRMIVYRGIIIWNKLGRAREARCKQSFKTAIKKICITELL